MIARIWHGMTEASITEDYVNYMIQTGVTELAATPGNKGVFMLRRLEGDRAHFLMISLWESEAAIRRFAGEDIQKARYYPKDQEYLLELEPTVTHFEVVAQM
jgi:heme-degrading monooxygenase HmoA